MRFSFRKDIDTYQENIELSFKTTRHLIFNTRKCLEALETVPKAENFTALSKTDIMKDEAFQMQKVLLQMKDYLNDTRFKDSLLELWRLNEEGIKYHHGYKIDDFEKFQFYNQLKREIDLLNDPKKSEEMKTEHLEIAETLMFVNKSMRSMHSKNNLFLENINMPKTVPFLFNKIIYKINTDILKKPILEEQKTVTQVLWKEKARMGNNANKYLTKR
jgi:hypothetical protein